MNKLSSLIKKYQTIHKVKRSQLAKELGYIYINKALRRLDAFTENPIIDSDFSIKLRKTLSIPFPEYELAIKQDLASQQEKLKSNFKPSVRIILSGCPSPVIAGGTASRLKLPKNIDEMSFDEEIVAIFELYKQHQLMRFKNTNNKDYTCYTDYSEFLKDIEKKIAQRKPICWAIGKGYQYFRSFNDTLEFDRSGKLVKRT